MVGGIIFVIVMSLLVGTLVAFVIYEEKGTKDKPLIHCHECKHWNAKADICTKQRIITDSNMSCAYAEKIKRK